MSKKTGKSLSNNKKIILFSSAFILLTLVCVLVVLNLSPKNYTVAFYKIEDQQKQGISEVLSSIAKKQNIEIVFTQYDSNKSLKEQLLLSKKPSLIITTSGFAVSSAVEKSSKRAGIPTDNVQGMTSSMRAAIKFDDSKKRIKALPILSSHFEMAVERSRFQNSSVKQINTWNDVERFMREQKRHQDAPLIFAGGEPNFLLDLVGAFAESIDGISSYSDAVKILKKNENSFNATTVAKTLCDEPDSPLATTVKQLSTWYKQGLIHQGTFSLQPIEVEAFAEGTLSSIMFMPLETHRSFAQKTISRYISSYLPSEHSANARIFTGHTYYAVPFIKSSKTEILLNGLVSVESQESLSRATGLAPVLAQCRTPDKQADDARYWIAATSAPFAGLSQEVFMSKEAKKLLASEIAARIKQ